MKAFPDDGLTVKEKMFESPLDLYLVQAAPSYFVVVFWTETQT